MASTWAVSICARWRTSASVSRSPLIRETLLPARFLSASLRGGDHAHAGVDPDDASARSDRSRDFWKIQAVATAKVKDGGLGLEVQLTEQVPPWPTVEQRLQRDQIVESTHGVVASPAPHGMPPPVMSAAWGTASGACVSRCISLL